MKQTRETCKVRDSLLASLVSCETEADIKRKASPCLNVILDVLTHVFAEERLSLPISCPHCQVSLLLLLIMLNEAQTVPRFSVGITPLPHDVCAFCGFFRRVVLFTAFLFFRSSLLSLLFLSFCCHE